VARRFSTDTSPPLPQLPPSFSAQAENIHVSQSAVAGGPIEKSSSTYDSLCVNSIIVSLLFIKTFES
jgi:hypothetical protein